MTSYVTTSECLKDTMCESPPGGCCSERCLEAAVGIAPRDVQAKGESVVRERVDITATTPSVKDTCKCLGLRTITETSIITYSI